MIGEGVVPAAAVVVPMHQEVMVVSGLKDYLVDVFGACTVLAG